MHLGEDYAKNPGLSVQRLNEFLDDIQAQPEWRIEANRAADYYDGRQLEPGVIAKMEERGQPVLIHNLIAPAIDGVLGMEARTRTDWQVTADNDEFVDTAEALNQELNEASRITMSDRACADAYAAQVKTGLGWVEINRNPDPFEYRYRVNSVHRREIYWDWHAKRPDLKDARWLLRRRWLDEDEAINAFPRHAELIKQAVNGWSDVDSLESLIDDQTLMGAYTQYTEFRHRDSEWLDSARRRTAVYEVYYRHYVRKPVLQSSEGTVVEFDLANDVHNALLSTGRVQISMVPFAKMRLAYFVGPHRVVDVPSPQPHNHFPYVPFWGFREDGTGAPYGLIRRMMPAQDEINHRRSKLTWLLNAKRVIKDDDALLHMSESEMMDELYRADGVINLNPNRKNKDHNAFRVEVDLGVSAQQFQVMQEAEKLIQDTAGIYSSFLGQESGAKSGVAINSLVEQGATTLGELNDNHRFARQMVGELLLAHIVQDLSQRENYQVKVNVNKPQKTKVITLNETSAGKINNQVIRTKAKVVLSDITNTPSYRAQIAHQLTQLAVSLPPDMQAILLDLVVDATDLPMRDEISKRIRAMTGQGQDEEELTKEQRAQREKQLQAEAQKEKMMMGEMQARLQKLTADARKANAQAAQAEQQAAMTPEHRNKTQAETQRIMAEVEKILSELQTAQLTQQHILDQSQHPVSTAQYT